MAPKKSSIAVLQTLSRLQLALGIVAVLAVLFVLGGLVGLGVSQMKHEVQEKGGTITSLLSPRKEEEQKASPAPALSSEVPPAPVFARTIALPKPAVTGGMPLQQVLQERRSRRDFSDKAVSLQKLSQLLWSAQGITGEDGKKRTAPSAYEVYPIVMYAVVRNVSGLEPGLYQYIPETHSLGDLLLPNAGMLLNETNPQDVVKSAPVVLVAAATYGKGVELMQENAKPSAILEVGHIGQNVYLQAESLKMATVVVAGFDPAQIGKTLKLDFRESVVYLIPVGERAPEMKK